jgi:hypothetical protein
VGQNPSRSIGEKPEFGSMAATSMDQGAENPGDVLMQAFVNK